MDRISLEWFNLRMNSTLRVLLVGYGLSGRTFHLPLIEATNGLSVTGIVTANKARGSQARQDLPHAELFPSADDAWSALNEFDIAVVATANASHSSIALAALERGLHVVIDKPATGNSEEFSKLESAAVATGKQVHVFQNRRWDSDFMTLQNLNDSGYLGTLHRFESRMESLRNRAPGSWRDSPDPSHLGGVLLDLGSHLVDQALEFMGPVRSVYAKARSIRSLSIADDDVEIILTHENNGLSILIASKVSAFSGPRFTAMGNDGAVWIDALDSQETALRSGIRPDSKDWGQEPPTAQAMLRTIRNGKVASDQKIPFVKGSWNSYYPAVLGSVRNGLPAPVRLSDVRENMRVLDAARLSSLTGSAVRLDPTANHGG